MAPTSTRASADERGRAFPLAVGEPAVTPARRTALSRVIRADSGMSIVGQGGRIMLRTAPAALLAVVAHLRAPALATLPPSARILAPLGVTLLAIGAALWLTAVVQLVAGFSHGKLVTTGAYGVCRNPIYSSVALLVLPGVALVTGAWVYLGVGAVLCLAVRRCIPEEERDLARVFGDEYRRYTARVHRMLPFARPRGSFA